MHEHEGNLEDFKKILADHRLVVVDFTATWCPPCKLIGPIFKAESEKPDNNNIFFVKLDVDQADVVAQHYNINAVPTFIFYKDGLEVARVSGAKTEELIAKISDFRGK